MVIDALPNLQWEPAEDDRSLIAEADDELLDLLHAQIIGLTERTVYPALERARERGEIGTRPIPRLAAMTVGLLLRDRLVFTRADVDRDTIAEILDTVYLPLITAVSGATL